MISVWSKRIAQPGHDRTGCRLARTENIAPPPAAGGMKVVGKGSSMSLGGSGRHDFPGARDRARVFHCLTVGVDRWTMTEERLWVWNYSIH